MRKVFPPIPDSWRKSSWQCGSANMDALVVTPRCKSRFGSVGGKCGCTMHISGCAWVSDLAGEGLAPIFCNASD